MNKIKKQISEWLMERDYIFQPIIFVRSILIKPLRLLYHKRYTPNFKEFAAIDITDACNMRCINCEASCRQAPSNNHMSIEQIQCFIDDAIKLKYSWKRIVIRGGEPALHPQFEEIIQMFKKYKDYAPSCRIVLDTNSISSKLVEQRISNLPKWIEISTGSRDKKKGKMEYYFNTYNIAPIDTLTYMNADFTKGCIRTANCFGLCATSHGYYMCCPGGSVDRVFDFNVGIDKLENVTEEELKNQLRLLCQYCGHFKEPNDITKKEKMSKSWKSAYERYNIYKQEKR